MTCDDVAIIGAGVGGTYAAWRLRTRNLSITMYELSDRVGGRMHTVHFPNTPDINVELGAMRFIPDSKYEWVGVNRSREAFTLNHMVAVCVAIQKLQRFFMKWVHMARIWLIFIMSFARLGFRQDLIGLEAQIDQFLSF